VDVSTAGTSIEVLVSIKCSKIFIISVTIGLTNMQPD